MDRKERSSLTLRLPAPIKAWLHERAAANGMSQNAEIIRLLLERMQAATGERFGDTTPAAAGNTAALQGRDIITQG